MTLDEAIAQLTAIREKVGGDATFIMLNHVNHVNHYSVLNSVHSIQVDERDGWVIAISFTSSELVAAAQNDFRGPDRAAFAAN
jgi:hypothetical protein